MCFSVLIPAIIVILFLPDRCWTLIVILLSSISEFSSSRRSMDGSYDLVGRKYVTDSTNFPMADVSAILRHELRISSPLKYSDLFRPN